MEEQPKKKLSLKIEAIEQIDAKNDSAVDQVRAGLCIDIPTIDIPSPNDTSCLGLCIPGCSCATLTYTAGTCAQQ